MKADGCKVVAYYRVSTDKQGRSGLGMEAQLEMVTRYISQSGCELLASLTEVESGSDCDRPELNRALALCKRHKAVLLIAKLDRLGRDVHFITGLAKQRVEYCTADSPYDDEFAKNLKATFAQEERRKISLRTKEALAAKKARGESVGRPENLTDASRRMGAAKNRENAIVELATLTPLLSQWRASGMTLAGIAHQLNAIGRSTRNGSTWTPCAVKRVLDRA